jgi:hypothetical protein
MGRVMFSNFHPGVKGPSNGREHADKAQAIRFDPGPLHYVTACPLDFGSSGVFASGTGGVDSYTSRRLRDVADDVYDE